MNEFDKNIRNRLRDYQEQPDENAWDAIENKLSKHKFQPLPWILLLLLLITAGITGIWLNTSPHRSLTNVKEDDTKIGLPETMDSTGYEQKAATQRKEKAPHPGESYPAAVDGSREATSKEAAVNGPPRQIDVSKPSGSSPGYTSVASKRLTMMNKKINNPVMYVPQLPFVTDSIVLKKVQPIIGLSEPEEQRKSKDDQKSGRLYVLAMPYLSFNHLRPNNSDDYLITDLTSPKIVNRIAWRLELGYTQPLSERLEMMGAVSLLHFRNNFSVTSVGPADSATYSPGNGGITVEPIRPKRVLALNEPEIQLAIMIGGLYKLNLQESVEHSAGLSMALNRTLTDSEIVSNTTSCFINFNVFYRLVYPRHSAVQFLFQPTFNYSLNKQSIEDQLTVTHYGIGLNVGFSFKF